MENGGLVCLGRRAVVDSWDSPERGSRCRSEDRQPLSSAKGLGYSWNLPTNPPDANDCNHSDERLPKPGVACFGNAPN